MFESANLDTNDPRYLKRDAVVEAEVHDPLSLVILSCSPSFEKGATPEFGGPKTQGWTFMPERPS
jgi:hypothetical protein